MIVDTHVHVVSEDRSSYPPLPNAPDWPVTTGEFLSLMMDKVGISHAVLVQTFFTYGFDNSYAIDCAKADPSRFMVVCVIDQLAPGAPDLLSNLVETRNVRGIRLMPKGQPPGALWDERTFAVWRRAQELQIPVTVAAEIEHIPHMPAVVERFPDVTVCFEHMWGLEIGQPPFEQIKPVLELARFPNVRLKLAPNNSFAAREAGVEAERFFGLLVERFGIDRLMWGSNYPAHSSKFGALADRLEIMRRDFAFLGTEGCDKFFAQNAIKLWPFTGKAS